MLARRVRAAAASAAVADFFAARAHHSDMSDTADDDSGFDKEAEREKLEEKFARDERKRESTRRMSELLLKGATMTNSHCDACGSPIFRQNGQEFCPECDGGGGASGEGAPAARKESAPGADGTDAAVGTPSDPDADSGSIPASEPAETDRTASTGPTHGSAPADTTPADATGARDRTDAAARPTADPTRQSGTPRPTEATAGVDRAAATAPAAAGAGDDAVAAAGDALATTLRRHAEAARDATDPRTATAHLEAAREAAEALAALRR